MKTYVHLGQPIRRTEKGNWVYTGGPESGKTVEALLVPWEDRKAPIKIVSLPPRRISSLEPIKIPKEDIAEGIIPKESVSPISKDDPELPRNSPTPPNKEPSTSGPSGDPPNKPQGDPPVETDSLEDESVDKDNMSDKLNEPKEYDGTRTKYREWIYECHMYIVANPTKFADDKSKILFILSYMREGTASMFAQQYYYDRELRA